MLLIHTLLRSAVFHSDTCTAQERTHIIIFYVLIFIINPHFHSVGETNDITSGLSNPNVLF